MLLAVEVSDIPVIFTRKGHPTNCKLNGMDLSNVEDLSVGMFHVFRSAN